jgi:EAL domain-containing protein (putative c-di-GMP-specific phosphodiesterase class I)
VSIDDFGAGYSGLNLLAEVMPDAIKLDRGLVHGLHRCRQRRAIVAGVTQLCEQLNIDVVAEGVESVHDLLALAGLGIRLAQGYLFARPAVGQFPPVHWPHELEVELGTPALAS